MSSNRTVIAILSDIKARLDKIDEYNTHALFASVLIDIEKVSATPDSEEKSKTMDPKEVKKRVDLFASPTETPLLREYDLNYGSFMRFYRSLHENDLKNLDPKKKKLIDQYAEEFPNLIEDLTKSLNTMLEIDADSAHEKHYRDLADYLSQFKELIQSEEKRQANESRKTSGGPGAS